MSRMGKYLKEVCRKAYFGYCRHLNSKSMPKFGPWARQDKWYEDLLATILERMARQTYFIVCPALKPGNYLLV